MTLRAKGQSIKPAELWKLGFGSIASSSIIKFCDNPSNCSGTISIALLANIPQIILSSAYFLYNNMLTAMLLAAEYNDYAIERKPLRVSWAKGLQRSTYYLSLPYRYSIPLMICNTILHWLVSQSFFFVEVVLYDMAGRLTTERLIACGYSPIALMVAILLGFVMVCTILGMGLKHFRTNMPLAVSCSAAISAACHPRLVTMIMHSSLSCGVRPQRPASTMRTGAVRQMMEELRLSLYLNWIQDTTAPSKRPCRVQQMKAKPSY